MIVGLNKQYKFGIIVKKYINGYKKSVAVCNCGQCLIKPNYNHNYYNNNYTRYQCDKCGNAFFVDAWNQSRGRFVIPYLESSRKDNRGFKVKRINLSIKYDDKETSVTPIKENLVREIEYDIVDGVLKVWRDGVLEYDTNNHNTFEMEKANKMFFMQMDEDLFFDFISNDVTRGLYKVARTLSNNGWNRKRLILKGLRVMATDEYKWMQILANAGIPDVDRFIGTTIGYGANRRQIIDISAKKPHQILKVPKFFIPYIREDVTINSNVLSNLQGCLKNIDVGKLKEIMSIVKDEGTISDLSNCIDNIMQIHIDYDYSNLKKLVLYLFREVRLYQGITSPSNATTYLRDYIRMSRFMGLKWDKYPKSLKKEHDVVQMNYNMINNSSKQKELFELAIQKKSYKSLEFGLKDKNQKYAIVIPKSPEDIVREGNKLSHCVASYVGDVNNDRCKIVFLRDKEDLEKPLATIEVRGMNIRQAKGYANMEIPEDQRKFISLWAEENNLVEAYY